MPRIGSPITELRDSKIYKLVANILTLVMFLNISIPAYAVTNANEFEDYLEGSGRYEFSDQELDPVFKSIFTSNASFIFDGFGYFYEQVVAHNSDAFENVKLVPINVSDITIFVPAIPSKPLYIGTPYVERGILKNQLYQLLNKSWISVNNGGYSDFNELTKDLYDNAQKLITNKQFKFGQNLTQAQIDNLSEDVIWPEKRTLRSGKSVYIPLVYLSKATIASNKLVGSQFSFNNADINTKNFVVNGVSIEARRNLIINTLNNFTAIANGKVIAGGDLTINSGNELSNLSSKISGQTVTLTAHKLTNNTLVSRYDYGHGFSESFDTLGVIESIGDLNIQTSGDLISHGGQFDTQASMRIVSGGDVILRTQQANNERYQSGDGWTDSEKSLVNLQTQLSAIDLLSITASNSIISHGAIIKSEGILELLADKGITIIPAEDIYSSSKSFDTSGSGVFGSDESESEDLKRATIVRSLLKAGNSMVLKTEQGNIVLKAASVDSRGSASLIAKNGEIDFRIAKLIESLDVKKSYEGSLSFRYQGHGYNREVAYYNEFITSGGLMLDANNGVRIEYVGDGSKNLDDILNSLSQNPELAWMQQVRNDPNIDPIVWDKVELILDEWDYDQSGLSPAAMAILAVVMAVATGGGGLAVLAEGAIAAGVNAAVTAMVIQASASLLANGGDISLTLKELGSKDSLKSLAATMVTAGVLNNLNSTLFSGATDAATGVTLPNYFEQFAGLDAGSLVSQLSQRMIQTTVSTSLSHIVTGESFDSLGKSLTTSLMLSSISFLGEKLANNIGLAASDKDLDGNSKEIEIDIATQYIAHAALGCALGSANTAINGGNSEAAESGCFSGAGGAIIGEFVAKYKRAELEEKQEKLYEFVGKELLASQENKKFKSVAELQIYREKQFKKLQNLQKQGVDISRLVAGITIFALGGDTQTAIDTAENAAANNAFFIPVLIWAANAVLIAMTVSDFIDSVSAISTLIKSGNKTAAARLLLQALMDAGIDITIGKAGSVIKVGDKIEDIIKKVDLDKLLDSAEYALKQKGMDGFASEVTYLKKVISADDISDTDRPYKGVDTKNVNDVEKLEAFHSYRNNHNGAKLNFETWKAKIKNEYIDEKGVWRNINGPSGKKIDVYAKGKEESFVRNNHIDVNGLNRSTSDLDGNVILDCNFNCMTELRQKAQQKSSRLDVNNPADKAKLDKLAVQKRAYSEQLGEMAAEGYIKKSYPDAEYFSPRYPGSKTKRDQFDQIWKTKDGKVIIIEAKGGVSITNGDRLNKTGKQRVQQGTAEYNDAIINRMEVWYSKNLNHVDKDGLIKFKKTLALLKANKDNTDYIMVKQPVSASTGKITDKLKVTKYIESNLNDYI